jgi:hypothetical protein
MNRRAELPGDLNGQPFLARTARELGVPWSRLRGPDLAAPFRGVRTPAGYAAEVLDRCRAYDQRMPRTHVFSHVTAALLHGMPLPFWLCADPDLHVTVPADSRSPQVEGVVGHELRPELWDVEFISALPVTSPLQTWIDLGTLLGVDDLVAVADYVCRGKHPRYTPADLRAAAAAVHGRRGCRALRAAAALARTRVESPKETQTRLLLIYAGLPEPVIAVEVPIAAHGLVLHPDLGWPQFRACLEYEGDEHRTDKKRFRRDITRREMLEDVGWRVIRVTDDDLTNGGRLLINRVRATLVARGWRG